MIFEAVRVVGQPSSESWSGDIIKDILDMEEDMDKLSVGDRAPDFSLAGADGKTITLSEVCAEQSVILVFNIGFA